MKKNSIFPSMFLSMFKSPFHFIVNINYEFLIFVLIFGHLISIMSDFYSSFFLCSL